MYYIFRAAPNSCVRFGAILMKNSSNLLTLGRAHASIALLSLNRNFQHELGQILRAVIHDPRCPNFRASKFTVRRGRAGFILLPKNCVKDIRIVTMTS